MTTDTQVTEVITLVTLGEISLEDAARRLGILATEPDKYHCGTCRFLRGGECHRPGQPPRTENKMSVRCGDYEGYDARDYALPAEPVRSRSRMWK